MKIYMAGSIHKEYASICHKYGMVKLFSALNEGKQIEKYPRDRPLCIDSGAHSWNKTTINRVGGKARERLMPAKQWLQSLAQLYPQIDFPGWILVELDVYHVLPKAEIDAMARFMKKVLKHASFMRVYHITMDNGNLAVLKQWLDEGETYIGLGLDTKPIMDKIFRLTRDRIKYHVFAATDRELMLRYPFYSVDSSTAGATIRYGGIHTMKGYKSRDWVAKNKNISAVMSPVQRLDASVKVMRQLQDEVTAIWKKRGVEWK